jgi:hypothetical protein
MEAAFTIPSEPGIPNFVLSAQLVAIFACGRESEHTDGWKRGQDGHFDIFW